MTSEKILQHIGEIIATSSDDISVIKCVNCGFIHQYPLPNVNEREKYYIKSYFQETKTDYFKKQKEDLEYLKTDYFYKENIFRKNVVELPLKILDIGAGSGLFLKYFQDKGWKIKGIEPNEQICEITNNELNINLDSCTFDNFLKTNDEKFSVVHLSFVLEHVINPISMLNSIYESLLIPNGIICVEVPNDFNPLQETIFSMLNNNWWVCRDHINYFNVDSLNQLLEKCGFKVFNIKVSFPIEFFVLMGDNYIFEPELGRSSHLRRVNFEKNLNHYNKKFKNKLYEKFIELKIGRDLSIFGRRD